MSGDRLDIATAVRGDVYNALIDDLVAAGVFPHRYAAMETHGFSAGRDKKVEHIFNQEHATTVLIALKDLYFVDDFASHLRQEAKRVKGEAEKAAMLLLRTDLDEEALASAQRAHLSELASAAAYERAAETLEKTPPWGNRNAFTPAVIKHLSDAGALPWKYSRVIALLKQLADYGPWIKRQGSTFSTSERFETVMLAIHRGAEVPAYSAATASQQDTPSNITKGANGVSLPSMEALESLDQKLSDQSSSGHIEGDKHEKT